MEGYVIIRIPNSLLININLIKLFIYIVKQLILEYNIKIKQKDVATILNLSESYISKLFQESNKTINRFKESIKNIKQKSKNFVADILSKNKGKNDNKYLYRIIRFNKKYFFVIKETKSTLVCVNQNLKKVKLKNSDYISYNVSETYDYCAKLYNFALNYLNNLKED